ncbi:MAG: YgeY family selenium metabolism-linked hydrolase [Anaerolineae bacterium]|nr:YgeY family selenium metabolism-linked hydrolase [Anaerolineae bacterium]
MQTFSRRGDGERLRLSQAGRDGLSHFAQQLVRTRSLSTQEGDVAALVQAELARLGIEPVWVDRIGNVVARIGNTGGPTLLYNAHMDTVGVTDPAAWRHDPFAGVIQSGALYGRGSVDMKGALAAMVYGAALVQTQARRLKGNLTLAFVVQEEPCEGYAMSVLVKEGGLRPDWVLLGEPSDLTISRGHRGRVMLKVTVRGKSSHGAKPHLGINAVYAAAQLIFSIQMMEFPSDPALGSGTIALTHIESRSPSLNAVPDRCTFYLDRRLTLGETVNGALTQVQALIARENLPATVEVTDYAATSYTGYECRRQEAFPAWVLPDDHKLLAVLKQSAASVLGSAPEVRYWDFSTDGAYTAGEMGIPTVGFGPGDETLAHTDDEHIRLKDIWRAAEVYAAFALDMLS